MASHIRNLFFKKPNYFVDGSVIVATGAGSGICKQVVLEYAKRNCSLVLADINQAALDEVKAIVEGMGFSLASKCAYIMQRLQCGIHV